MKFYVLLIACVIAWGLMELGAEAPLPPGWKWTSARADTANCKAFQGERPTWISRRPVSLRCTSSDPGFAAVRYAWPVETYRGKQVTLSAQVKLNDVKDNARLWIRADREGQYGAALNMMENRPLKGNSEWVTVNTELVVPEDATVLMTGAILFGSGTISVQNPILYVSGSRNAPASSFPIPPSAPPLPQAPPSPAPVAPTGAGAKS
jgi:hypothetical protein